MYLVQFLQEVLILKTSFMKCTPQALEGINRKRMYQWEHAFKSQRSVEIHMGVIEKGKFLTFSNLKSWSDYSEKPTSQYTL